MATSYLTPGVYVEEISGGARPIQAVGTSVAAFVGIAPDPAKYVQEIASVANWSQFVKDFAGKDAGSTPLSNAVYGHFLNGGGRCYVVNVGKDGTVSGGGRAGRKGVDLLEELNDVSIVCSPGFADAASYDAVLSHCEKMKDRIAILDAAEEIANVNLLTQVATAKATAAAGGPAPRDAAAAGAPTRGLRPRNTDGGYGAFYAPWIAIRDPLEPDEIVTAPPCGHLAGIYARTDALRGVFKAPANEVIRGALDTAYHFTHDEQALLNPAGVNCIRLFGRDGIRVWGARTLADAASEWRYVPVRRLFAMMEKSILEGTRWVVFEPNDEPLWKAICRDVGAFLTLLWRGGALMGGSAEQAFFVKCDAETNPKEVIDAGRVEAVIGCAPVKPAEFVIFRIGQEMNGSKVEAEA